MLASAASRALPNSMNSSYPSLWCARLKGTSSSISKDKPQSSCSTPRAICFETLRRQGRSKGAITSGRLVQIQTKTLPTHVENRLQTGTTKTLTIDTAGLEKDLRKVIGGEVRFGAADRAMYASDASNYRMVPLGIVLPRDADDVIATVAICRQYGAPIFGRGGGTSIPGQTVNSGMLIDFSKFMNEIVELDPQRKYA